MILPSSKEEDKFLEKHYAVFNDDGSQAKLKGFEVKRRGKSRFSNPKSSRSSYLALLCKDVMLLSHGLLISGSISCIPKRKPLAKKTHGPFIYENRSMSKTLTEYGGQKSTSISTAKRNSWAIRRCRTRAWLANSLRRGYKKRGQ